MWKLTKKQKRNILFGVLWGFAIIGMLSSLVFVGRQTKEFVETMQKPKRIWEAPSIDKQLLEPNEYSRPQLALTEINGIVVHYTANPGTTAQQNRDYFEGLSQSHLTKDADTIL